MIIMTHFSENLDSTGSITDASIGLNWQDGSENFAASVSLTDTDLTDGTTLDDKSKNEIFKLAVSKFLSEVTTAVNEVTGTATKDS
jgi:hypothetical protein